MTQQRKHKIGASDLPAIMELEPYHCKRRKWFEVAGVKPEFEISDTFHTLRGKRLESIAADYFSEITGFKLLKVPPRQHPKYPFIGASPDRKILHPDKKRFPGLLEIKIPGQWHFKKIQQQGIPESWQVQVLFGMYITKWEWSYIAVFWADGWEMKYEPIEKDPDRMKDLQEIALDFWISVEKKQIPDAEATAVKCKSCPFKETCFKIGVEIKEKGEEKILTPSVPLVQKPALETKVQRFIELRNLKNEIEENLQQLRDEIKELYPTDYGEVIQLPKARVMYRKYQREQLNSKALKEQAPEIYSKFVYLKNIEDLRIYEIW